MTHEEMIRQAHDALWSALPETCTQQDKERIEDAFQLAKEAHKTQTRDSGQPYILHPLAVALITVREMRQKGAAIVAAALLHDVVEDTDCTIEEIRERFGGDVAFLVEAVTKPNKKQVDNFQHILGSVKGDIRVLLLKLSDRLHNMRTLSGLRPQKQWKIASETQFFFAPLAGRLGLFQVKSELENLAFQFLNPQEFARIAGLLEEDKKRTETAVNTFMNECLHTVGAQMGGGIGWDIRYRNPYSIWREMQERKCDFYRVPFKHYIRVHFDRLKVDDELNYSSTWWLSDEDIIFRIYGILTNKYREQTGSFVNYVAQPKANGYRSVHFRLLNPYGGIEEFHVASDDMREQSYYGCILDSKEQWLKRLTDVLNELSEDPESLMPGIHDSLYNEDIVVFTPKSKAISLPKGSTALDFAYGLHSDIGDHARYARINGRLASVKAELKRGDCVEIGTDANTHPKAEWMEAVSSYKAKKQIRAYLKRQPKPGHILCPHCHPMPGSEII
ncbi:MAG: bifunctional (p)ppGpp synthetase/guanosine-3',5'-bis(diphosphate) 3'-pyrophosphohydrolase, partial [Bacteroidales bacterium]|nr:bifunctional (p)ppGpp synthetase/guanosine-3',5'-bis(diphosphate) 3'-pyrophosphohydrolase [Bacteroidales bacterium]